jgi:hypothetical protein
MIRHPNDMAPLDSAAPAAAAFADLMAGTALEEPGA